jgi:hypothetical protein
MVYEHNHKDPEKRFIREECQGTPTHGDLPAPYIYD